MTNFLTKIYNGISKKQTIIISIVFLLFTAIALPLISSYTAGVIGVSKSPDTSFSFQVSELYRIVQLYGKEGRTFYIVMRWTFDIVWPAIYTLFLVSAISYLAGASKTGFGYKVLYLPLLAVTFDLLENIFATIIMAIYPTMIDSFVYALFISSIAKWIMIVISFILVIYLFLRRVFFKN